MKTARRLLMMSVESEFRERLGQRIANRFTLPFEIEIEEQPQKLAAMWSLTSEVDSQVGWRALWVCEHLCRRHPEWFVNMRVQIKERLLRQPMKVGPKRLYLNMLLFLPAEEETDVELLDFCLNTFSDTLQTPALRSLCLKHAYRLCVSYPELLGELRILVEQTMDYSPPPAIRSVVSHLKWKPQNLPRH